MTRHARLLVFPLIAALFSGCAIHQKVTPVEKTDDRQVCIIEKPSVRPGFLETYKRVLTARGYAVKQLPQSASLVECAVTSTYNASWRWDLALYMALAEINVYRNGKPVGEAHYDSQRGGANFGKFIDAEAKITELVSQLFPENLSQ